MYAEAQSNVTLCIIVEHNSKTLLILLKYIKK